jgi:DNA-binding response OmpR family regulator
VEDDAGIPELVTLNLERDGLRVEHVRDAEIALLALRKSQPDLLMLDLGLPGMDGLEICRLVRRERRTPILIVTPRRTRWTRSSAWSWAPTTT